MSSRRVLDAALLAAAVAITRFAFRSRYLYDIDSVNFALGMQRFAPGVHQPHPPGYFLYVCLGRLVNLIFHDANTSLVVISILFSCLAVAAIYGLADSWFGRRAAFFAGLIFVFSPLIWFHGTVALTYIVEAFFSALAGYLCWRIDSGAAGLILPGAVALGIAAGFRPSSLLLLSPMFLFSLRQSGRKRAAAGCAALLLTLLAWFVPMISIGGGTAYFSSLLSLWLTVPSRGMVFNSSLVNSLARACTIVGIYCLCFGCAVILPYWRIRGNRADRRKKIFTWVWIAPGLLFFTFIYLKFVNSGYLLALAPPVCAWMGLWASTWYANLRMNKALKIGAVGACAAANAAIFIWAPVYCSYREVRKFEGELASLVRCLPQIASPADTLIVGFDSHFLGYRHAGYYLPDYLTVQFPEVQLALGMRIFTMQHRDTRLEKELTVALPSFVLFPLPPGDKEYGDYMEMVQKRFPAGHLRMVSRGGHVFAMGPIADLPYLYPPAVHAEARQSRGDPMVNRR